MSGQVTGVYFDTKPDRGSRPHWVAVQVVERANGVSVRYHRFRDLRAESDHAEAYRRAMEIDNNQEEAT